MCWRSTLVVAVSAIGLGATAAAQTKPVARPPAPAAKVAAAPAITNADVIKMVRAGLGESLVVTTIRQTERRAFALTPDGLVELKAAGVSDNIIRVMMDPKATVSEAPAPTPVAAADAPRAASAPTPSPEDPEAAHDAGIYVELGTASAHKLFSLEPTVFSQGKSGGLLTSALTYGLKKAKWKAIVRGRAGSLRLREQQPVFYFYFEKKTSGLSNTGGFAGWMSGASSPNEFILAKMDQKSSDRELIVGEFGMLGSSSGTRSEDTVDLKIERLTPGVYKVTPSKPLEIGGEYCLFYAAGAQMMGTGGGAGKLFDFGIDAAK
jgi:hypothetical protein